MFMRILPANLPVQEVLPPIDADDLYADRLAAGRQLAELLLHERGSRALVLALPPGGVVVAREVTRALRLSWDVLVAREIVIRPYPAFVAGALSEGGGLCLNRAIFRLPGASMNAFWREARRATREIADLVALYRPGRPLRPLHRRSVILVDDGMGDGLLQLAAIAALRRLHAARCVVATPFGTSAALQRVTRRADFVVALNSAGPAARERWEHTIGDAEAAALAAHGWRHGAEDAEDTA
jgi:predicted phosphoribosyltransferase